MHINVQSMVVGSAPCGEIASDIDAPQTRRGMTLSLREFYRAAPRSACR
jgi:hypothetical protein